MELTEHHDLRSGTPAWTDSGWTPPGPDLLPDTICDVAIIGSGVMGALVAERISAAGRSVVLLDRRPSGSGSTAASTAQVMWAIDVPMMHLADRIGEGEAARRWTRVYRAVRGLADRIDTLGVACGRADIPTVYLAGDVLDADGLKREAVLHAAHGLPSAYLDAEAVAARFGIAPRAAIVSSGGFSVDPVKLTHAMLDIARGRGALLCYPYNVTSIAMDGGVMLTLEGGGTVEARHVVLAGGYERARMFLPPAFALLSTFVMATAPGVAPLWRENAMIWEASDPYLYVRATPDGRIMAGGGDEDFSNPAQRDALIERKAGEIAAGLETMLGGLAPGVERRWAAMFGSSPDGLPAIGRARNASHLWLSAGFGGNGIAFAALAGEILAAEFGGDGDADLACFDPYRFE